MHQNTILLLAHYMHAPQQSTYLNQYSANDGLSKVDLGNQLVIYHYHLKHRLYGAECSLPIHHLKTTILHSKEIYVDYKQHLLIKRENNPRIIVLDQ